jgi:hypothetical protein
MLVMNRHLMRQWQPGSALDEAEEPDLAGLLACSASRWPR